MLNTAIIYEGQIVIVRTELGGRRVTVATEPRPATLADADTFLAVHSLRRTVAWDLGPAGAVQAPVEPMDNRFDGTVAARLDQAVGTTHEPFEHMSAGDLARSELDGWLISDPDLTEAYVVAGSSCDGDVAKIHMVGEGKDWGQRYTTNFPPNQLVMVAKRKH